MNCVAKASPSPKSFGLHHPVQVVKDRMGPQALIVGFEAPDPDPDASDWRHTQMAVLKEEVFDCVVRNGPRGSDGSMSVDASRPGRRVMDDASMQMRTSLVEKDRGSQS